jgi:hypothetical protein
VSKRFDIFAKAFGAGVPKGAPAVAYPSFTGSSAAFAAAVLAAGRNGVVLAVANGLPEADALYSDLEAIADEAGVRALEFPPEIEDDRGATAARLRVSAALGAYAIRPYPLVIVAPVMALREPVASAEDTTKAAITFSIGSPAVQEFSALQRKFAAAGYERVFEVSVPGEFSVRGGILDAWSPDAEKPVRAEFFGDELESLREFDPATQISVRKTDAAVFAPVELGRESGVERVGRYVTQLLPCGSAVMWLEHNSYDRGRADPAGTVFDFEVYSGDPAPRGVPTCPFMAVPLPGFAGRRMNDAVLVDRVRLELKRFFTAE